MNTRKNGEEEQRLKRQVGQLSNYDIMHEQTKNKGLRIGKFSTSHLKAASYDITPSIIAMSSRIGMLETVYRESKYPFHHYIVVSAKDSILVVSNEYIHVPKYIAGHVVSRVSKVVEGFGHISTSIDPGWSGAALIALSNPSNKPIKVRVGTSLNNVVPENPLATVFFNYLASPANLNKCNKYPGMRLDLLRKCCYKERRGFRAWWQRCVHPFRRRFTDFFFSYCQMHSGELNLRKWDHFISAFSGCPQAQNACMNDTIEEIKGKKKYPWDFVVQENVWTRFLYWYKHHYIFIRTIAIIVFVLLIISGVVPEEAKDAILSLFTGEL